MESTRGIVSCASCRTRKLKCDRKDPCSNCVTRHVDCVYALHGRARIAKSRREGDSQLADRIRHLERLVNTIVTSGSPSRDASAAHRSEARTQAVNDTSSTASAEGHSDSADSTGSEIKPGQVIRTDNELIYVSSMHWSSLCAELADIRDQFDEIQHAEVDLPDEQDDLKTNGPMLLDGGQATSDLRTVFCDMPPREVVDKLIFRYFNSVENSIAILHAPSFEQEYRRFWQDFFSVPVPWVALLFGVMALGTILCVRSQESLPPALETPADKIKVFQRRATDCLLISKYSTSPGPYTMEALLINAQNEFLRRQDAHLGVWVLGGIAIRLAFRMGYHRDPSNYPQLSPFEGEMRRRIWSIMVQVDGLTSYQLGLPPMVQESLCDTQIPRNLYDEDFGPDTIYLPPSRPLSELTPVLYVITKAEISAVFRNVFTRVVLGRTDSYDEIMSLDRRLESARDAISPRFRGFNLEDALTVAPFLMIRRYTLEMLYQKTVCMLHRHHMTLSFQRPEYSFSRHRCVSAAMSVLNHHTSILRQMRVGGSLYRNMMFVSSLEQADFLLASIIVCVELSSRAQYPACLDGMDIQRQFSQQDLVQALKEAHKYLAESKDSSKECRQAFDVLSIMLCKFSETVSAQNTHQVPSIVVESPHAGSEEHTMFAQRPMPNGAGLHMGIRAESQATSTPSTFQEIGSFFSSPDAVDWDLWEAFIRESAIGE